jgi:methanogenic corrinoid protein MtbC1
MSIQDLRQAVLAGDEDGAARMAQAELDAGTSPSEIMNVGLIGAMDEAGAKMATGELFIP